MEIAFSAVFPLMKLYGQRRDSSLQKRKVSVELNRNEVQDAFGRGEVL